MNDKDSNSNTSSKKALNNLFQAISSWQRPNSKKASSTFLEYFDLGELQKLEVERGRKIKYLQKASNESIQNQDDIQIGKLNGMIEEIKSKIKELKPTNKDKIPETKLLLKNDYLEIVIRELNLQIETTETKYEMIKKSHDEVVELLNRVHLKNEYQDMIDSMRKDLKNTIADYYEAKSLLRELYKIAWSMLPPKVAQICEDIADRMENLKKANEEIQYAMYKKHFEMSRMNKEIVALSSTLNGEFRIEKLYKKKIESSLVRVNDLKEKLRKICDRISEIQGILLDSGKYLDNTADMSNTSKSVKASTVKPPVPIETPIIVNLDKLEFYQEKLLEIEKQINVTKHEVEQQKKNLESIKCDVDRDTLRAEMKRSLQVRKLIATRLQQEIVLRKTYYNQIEDLKGKIRVFCRCRPISQEEIKRGNKQCVSFPDEFTVIITGVNRDSKGKEFQFDKVFPPNSIQRDVFKDSSILIQTTFDGFNVCIFAYGQTGSGKTFTLIGDIDKDPGIVSRAFERIFEIANEGKPKFRTQVHIYMLELYNEKLLDLLATDAVYSDKMEIKKDSNGMVIVPGAELIQTTDFVKLKELFLKGNSNRHIASTKMNSESSRSHLIISIIITCHIKNSEKIIRGKLSIIDLAGSERVSKSGVQGVGAQEAMSINISLSALGNVISALTTGQAFIPYRNNKLTMLMQDSIGGNAKTLMFVNISPVDYNHIESYSSLIYGARVKLIKNDIGKVPDSEEEPKLKKIIEGLMRGEEVLF